MPFIWYSESQAISMYFISKSRAREIKSRGRTFKCPLLQIIVVITLLANFISFSDPVLYFWSSLMEFSFALP